MPVYVGTQRVSSRNRLGRGTLITFADAWRRIEPLLPSPEAKEAGKITLLAYKESDHEFRFDDWAALAVDLAEVARSSGAGPVSRKNKFFQEDSDNKNVAPVIFKSNVPTTSNGWNNVSLFENLGHPVNPRLANESITSATLSRAAHAEDGPDDVMRQLKRRAEQEYIMQNIAKGPLVEACEIAGRQGKGIAIRGTSLLAHMGIESGAPTKAQEYKNKTSKDIDLFLCDELTAKDVGAVVHYDPRLGWTSADAERQSKSTTKSRGKYKVDANPKEMKREWDKKWAHVQARHKGKTLPSADALKALFTTRLKEYLEEDYEYRWGHYAPYTQLVGPCIRLKLRPHDNMYGDHDLFVFTSDIGYGKLIQNPNEVVGIQTALQEANAFQAQHGGIWYWAPDTTFNKGIRQKIMGAHSPPNGEPLIYVMPQGVVTAAFYIPGSGGGDHLLSVWDCPQATKWLETTHSGQLVLSPPA